MKKFISYSLSKSCELDPIPMHLLKDQLDVIIPFISEIVNQSLQHGKFSNILIPLLMKVNMELTCKNLRSITNVSIVSKFTECCAGQQIVTTLLIFVIMSLSNLPTGNSIIQTLLFLQCMLPK